MNDDQAWPWTPQVEAGQVVATLRRPPTWQVLQDLTTLLETSFQMPIVIRQPDGDEDFYTFVAVPRA